MHEEACVNNLNDDADDVCFGILIEQEFKFLYYF